MSTQLGLKLWAAPVALLVLVIANWLDAGVLGDAVNRAGHTYDASPLINLTAIVRILTAAGVVVLALTAWRSGSQAVGATYAAVGGFLVLLPTLAWTFDRVGNDMPTALAPEPIASTLGNWYFTLARGVTGAVFTLAAAMLLAGLAVVASSLRARHRDPARNQVIRGEGPAGEPSASPV